MYCTARRSCGTHCGDTVPLVVLGFGQNIEDALTASLRQTIDWLSRATSLSKLDVYALSSIAAAFA